MGFEQRELTGALFQNDKKGNEKAPNMKGKIKINGKIYFLSAWTNKDKNDNKYLSLMVKPADEVQQEAPPAPVENEPPF